VFDFGSGPRTSHPSAVNNGGEVHAALPVLLSSAVGRPIPFFSSEMVRTAFIRRTVERRARGRALLLWSGTPPCGLRTAGRFPRWLRDRAALVKRALCRFVFWAVNIIIIFAVAPSTSNGEVIAKSHPMFVVVNIAVPYSAEGKRVPVPGLVGGVIVFRKQVRQNNITKNILSIWGHASNSGQFVRGPIYLSVYGGNKGDSVWSGGGFEPALRRNIERRSFASILEDYARPEWLIRFCDPYILFRQAWFAIDVTHRKPRALIKLSLLSVVVNTLAGQPSLPSGEPGSSEYSQEGENRNGPRYVLVGVTFLLFSVVLLYKTWGKTDLYFPSNMSVSAIVAFVIISAILFWIGQWFLISAFGLL
jgi:hypothetical protein